MHTKQSKHFCLRVEKWAIHVFAPFFYLNNMLMKKTTFHLVFEHLNLLIT